MALKLLEFQQLMTDTFLIKLNEFEKDGPMGSKFFIPLGYLYQYINPILTRAANSSKKSKNQPEIEGFDIVKPESRNEQNISRS